MDLFHFMENALFEYRMCPHRLVVITGSIILGVSGNFRMQDLAGRSKSLGRGEMGVCTSERSMWSMVPSLLLVPVYHEVSEDRHHTPWSL